MSSYRTDNSGGAMPYASNSAFGGSGGAIFEGLILGSLLRNGGILGENNANGGSYAQGVLAGESAKYRDINDAKTSITADINAQTISLGSNMLNGFNNTNMATSNQTQVLGASILNGFNGLENSVRNGTDVVLTSQNAIANMVKDSAYADLLVAKDTQSLILKTACETNAHISCDGDKTRTLIASIDRENLKAELQKTQTQLDFAERGLQKTTGPTMSIITPNPCGESHAHDQINIINNNINNQNNKIDQIASAVQQVYAMTISKPQTA